MSYHQEVHEAKARVWKGTELRALSRDYGAVGTYARLSGALVTKVIISSNHWEPLMYCAHISFDDGANAYINDSLGSILAWATRNSVCETATVTILPTLQ